jgi:acyl homoserine lactone synthase
MTLKAQTLTRREFGENFDLVAGMHRLRARVFKGRLDWDVTVTGDMEIDSFDAEEATYLLIVTETREVVGHVRFLPTLGPNMLADIFPFLIDRGAPPCSPTIIEGSRFCVDTERTEILAPNGLRQATFMLFAAMLEWALKNGQRSIAVVTDTRMERVLRRAGWSLHRLGTPRMIDSTQAVAGILPVSTRILDTVRAAGGLNRAVLAFPEVQQRAA